MQIQLSKVDVTKLLIIMHANHLTVFFPSINPERSTHFNLLEDFWAK